jgi:phosphohistidine phosphatase
VVQNPAMRSLLLLRHAQTEDSRPGHLDHARRLTPVGEQQAARLGDQLRDDRTPIDLVLCSPATRARQTAEALGSAAPILISDRLYNAGAGDILAVLRGLADDLAHVLVVGHAPGLPAVVHELMDPDGSDPGALTVVESRFPAATLAVMTLDGAWADLHSAALVSVRLP